MCGIVGYIGSKNAKDFLLEGLEGLQYRGYDSAGIAIINQDGELKQIKVEGKIDALVQACGSLNGFTGIGHTRWATHGEPSSVNAHPHRSGKFTLVHNGIIENFSFLREMLKAKGYEFSSQTDTEVIAHLLNNNYNGSFLQAWQKTVGQLEGSYAIAAICSDYNGVIATARKSSPLIAAVKQGESFLSSDMAVLSKYADEVYVFRDGDIAFLAKGKIAFFDIEGHEVVREAEKMKAGAKQAQLGRYNHFMQKEINETSQSLRDTLSWEANNEAFAKIRQFASEIDKIHIVACGTAFHSGVCGKYIIEKVNKIPVDVEIASEFRYRRPNLKKGNLVLAISQSGETADTLAALALARESGCRTLAITNVPTSSIVRAADTVLVTNAGTEIGVAATKSYSTQLMMLYLLSNALNSAFLSEEKEEFFSQLRMLPTLSEEVADKFDSFEALAEKYKDYSGVFFIGRNSDYAIALEGALKLKEISYLPAEGYAAGELKHGTIAMITQKVLVIAIITQMKVADKMLSNIQEVKARKGSVVVITQSEEVKEKCKEIADDIIMLPKAPIDELMPILSVMPLQMFAYCMAIKKGNNPDQPRNLAKSVTVE